MMSGVMMRNASQLVAEINATFPETPYPSDHILSDCWCEECAWSVRNLRGKAWKQLRLADTNFSEGSRFSSKAFAYYLPALMTLAVEHPDELHLATEINSRFVVIEDASDHRVEQIQRMVTRLSKPQRTTLRHFFEWLKTQDWQAPMLIDAAIVAVSDLSITPVPMRSIHNECQAEPR